MKPATAFQSAASCVHALLLSKLGPERLEAEGSQRRFRPEISKTE
jgi:hypothetical protein